ncbi:hypothetical protein E5A73_15670 [Sphingomonas gei]|uniref:Type III secretion protein n=1 Tax=Sphingomonas gei TaxID=1395960 RepID=A0A4S1X893_9SPHN|nr:hypothetical protein [Sphingomonas gei]TGX52238.1 hypothetical protein E5A73_15670 [Sphingomonas gei]
MSIEAIAGAAASAASAPMPPDIVQAGPNASVSDITSFQGSLSAAGSTGVGSDALGPAMQAMFSQIERVNGEAKSVSEYAKAAQASGSEMTPGEVVDLTMKCHEFMFHCQLTSNIANRTSDGIQQLFRQQS